MRHIEINLKLLIKCCKSIRMYGKIRNYLSLENKSSQDSSTGEKALAKPEESKEHLHEQTDSESSTYSYSFNSNGLKRSVIEPLLRETNEAPLKRSKQTKTKIHLTDGIEGLRDPESINISLNKRTLT